MANLLYYRLFKLFTPPLILNSTIKKIGRAINCTHLSIILWLSFYMQVGISKTAEKNGMKPRKLVLCDNLT
jgi:hypothetical protein